jgi:hypothetical protein
VVVQLIEDNIYEDLHGDQEIQERKKGRREKKKQEVKTFIA